MSIQQKLSRLLELCNLSAVARKAHVSKFTILSLLSGRSKPKAETAAKLARALGVDAGWLIDDAQAWPPARVEQQLASPSAA